jgi:hypothetical protein
MTASVPPTRIALIHALAHSIAPVNEEIARQWPQCTVMNLLDDSLSADLARDGGGLDERMHERFLALAGYAVETGAQGILYTCSAFGPCIESVKRRYGALPVLAPNEAMIDDAVRAGRHIGLPARCASAAGVRRRRIGRVGSRTSRRTRPPDRAGSATPARRRLRFDRPGAVQHGAGGGFGA